MSSGKNPTMRHMQRTHGLSIAWIKERFDRKEFLLGYCPTREMSADIFTKAFIERLKWLHARKLIAHYLPEELGLGGTKVNGVINSLAQSQGGENRKSYNRIIIEFCCGPKSKLGTPTTWSKDCLVIRITEELDATKQSTLQYVLHTIRTANVPVMLFVAIPCTGGSPWQNINSKKPGGLRRMLKHKQLFNKLWNMLEIICEEIHKHKYHFAFEWPKGCSYWRLLLC